jgi:hypothetical protein
MLSYLSCMFCSDFAADIMTILSFTDAWGFVANGRDERGLLESWRLGLDIFGFVGRFAYVAITS